MKKCICILIAVGFTACTNFGFKNNETVLYEKGLELISQIDSLAESEKYISMVSADPVINSLIADIGSKDYKTPKIVFELTGLEAAIRNTLHGYSDLPKDIQEIITGGLSPSLVSQLNAVEGMQSLAATTILSLSDSFILRGVSEPVTYVYIFDNNSYGFMVTFRPSDENIINATGNVVINTLIIKCDTKYQISDFFNSTIGLRDVTVREVGKKREY